MSKFPATLKKLRKQSGMTQKELAGRLGSAVSTISMYERGEREPTFETLETLAGLFGVDMSYLVDGAPRESGVTEEDIKFALFGADFEKEVTDEMYEDVKRYAKFICEKRKENE